jgi:Zn-dependent protease with chaperone function
MFGNFIYFIVVLLIYSTYHPAEDTHFTALETLVFFFALTVVFAWVTSTQFRKIERRALKESFFQLDHRLSATITRQSVLAIVVFSIDIYALNLPSFLIDVPLLSTIPTIQALFFLGLFVGYLSIVWAFAHRAYRTLQATDVSRRSYILSNISFSIPILLPWLLLSSVVDIINALPFQLPKSMLATTEGQVVYFIVFLLAIAIVGPLIIQKFWRCKPLEAGYHRQRIESLCQRAGMEYANILYWPIFGGKMITAGVMGLVKKFRYILVTNALLRFLEADEIDAVIAHEIGHIKKKHLLFYLVFFIGYMLISFTSFDLLLYAILFAEPAYNFIQNTGFNQTTVVSSIFSLTIIVVFVVYFRYIFGYFMRNFERQADTYVFALFDSAEPLISTLEKIAATSGQPRDKPNWHHFSIKKRIDYLKKCEVDRSWISYHDRKIKRSIAAYMAGILIIGGIGYNVNFGETGKKINQHLFENIIKRELAKRPDNSDLYGHLGDLYYSNGDYLKTVQAYEQALALNPNNTKVLNNLAWLYATCEDETFRSPEKALRLAQRAVRLEESPYLLDTLAESYYVNGRFVQAISAARRALDLTSKNTAYYQKQLEKFTAAANKKRE